jgi:hypothetical protein
MNHVPVKSSNIESVWYDAGVLHVKFVNGGNYTFHGVSEAEHRAFMDSPSKGAHFAKHIRGKFKTEKKPA